MKTELECKIRVADLAALRNRLAESGGRPEGEHSERNWVFDTPSRDMWKRDMLLRLRTLDNAEEGLVTVKQPALSKAFKARSEIEIRVESAAGARAIFSAIGFEPHWYYEKRRASWRLHGCLVELDELPEIGAFVEVEGPTECAIKMVLGELGLDEKMHVPDSYLALFARHCEARGEDLRPMRFAQPSGDNHA